MTLYSFIEFMAVIILVAIFVTFEAAILKKLDEIVKKLK